MAELIRAAVLGHGYWGRNIARVLSRSEHFDLRAVCDPSPRALASVEKLYPAAVRVARFQDLPDEIDLVAVITPADTHFPLARHFLERGKHVLLTKPFTRTLAEAETLLELAEARGLTVFVDHTFVFNPAVRKLVELLPRIGEPYFFMSQRLNLGLYQADVNVIFDLMPHDLSMVAYLFGRPVVRAATMAFRAAGLPQEDFAHASVELEGGLRGLFTASWLSPQKVRQLFLVGARGMLLYDDVATSEKVKFFDRGISIDALTHPDSTEAYTSRISYRNGDLYSPAIPNTEALELEVGELRRAIGDVAVRRAYDRVNLDVMRGLEAVVRGAAPAISGGVRT